MADLHAGVDQPLNDGNTIPGHGWSAPSLLVSYACSISGIRS